MVVLCEAFNSTQLNNSTLLNTFAARKLNCSIQKQYLELTTKQKKQSINQSITTVQFTTSVQKIFMLPLLEYTITFELLKFRKVPFANQYSYSSRRPAVGVGI